MVRLRIKSRESRYRERESEDNLDKFRKRSPLAEDVIVTERRQAWQFSCFHKGCQRPQWFPAAEA